MNKEKYKCNFCSQDASSSAVQKIILADNVGICNECVDLCHEILYPEANHTEDKLKEIKELKESIMDLKKTLDNYLEETK